MVGIGRLCSYANSGLEGIFDMLHRSCCEFAVFSTETNAFTIVYLKSVQYKMLSMWRGRRIREICAVMNQSDMKIVALVHA